MTTEELRVYYAIRALKSLGLITEDDDHNKIILTEVAYMFFMAEALTKVDLFPDFKHGPPAPKSKWGSSG